MGLVILIDGPFGVGKTTLGRRAAAELGLAFIDGDDHRPPGQGWLRAGRVTAQAIAGAAEAALREAPGVVIAYPLRCTNWIWYRRRLGDAGHAVHCLGLSAAPAHIAARARVLSVAERTRSAEMAAQGYGRRPFATLCLRSDSGDEAACAARLSWAIRLIARTPCASAGGLTGA